VALILTVQVRLLAVIRLAGYAGMLGLAAAGWLIGGPAPASRKTLTITTAMRNVGVGLVIVTASLGGTPAVTAATAFGLFQTLLMALIALRWGKAAFARVAAAKQAG